MSDNNNIEIPIEDGKDSSAVENAEASQATGLDAARTEIAQLKDQLLRKAAEFENFKRRTRDEKDMLMKYGAESVILGLLTVIDDFERSLTSGKEHPDFESMFAGVEIVYGKLMRILENRGLRPIDAVGKPFDVDFHDALMQIPSAEVEPGTVLDVAEKGYMLYEKVIRHAKVTVSREPDTQTPEANA
ncbi:MAG: nucleotide exchange factor GrpE [Bacteroidota bacterium]